MHGHLEQQAVVTTRCQEDQRQLGVHLMKEAHFKVELQVHFATT